MTQKRGSQLPHAKLDEDDVRLVRELVDERERHKAIAAALTNRKIAEKFGVHVRTIDRITAGNGWGMRNKRAAAYNKTVFNKAAVRDYYTHIDTANREARRSTMNAAELQAIAKTQNLAAAHSRAMDPATMPQHIFSAVCEWGNVNATAIAWNDAETAVLVECDDVSTFPKLGEHDEVVEPSRHYARGIMVIEL